MYCTFQQTKKQKLKRAEQNYGTVACLNVQDRILKYDIGELLNKKVRIVVTRWLATPLIISCYASLKLGNFCSIISTMIFPLNNQSL